MNPDKVAFSQRQNEAIRFILNAHGTQRRKGSVLPYVIHPIETAGYLGKLYPKSHDLIIAGYLHDVLEDTHVTEDVLADIFGEHILALVLGVTSNGEYSSWKHKRQGQLNKLTVETDLDILRLKAADMLSNATSIAFDRFVDREKAFSKFKAPREDVIWYYESATRIFVDRIPEDVIVDLLSNQVEELSR